MHKIYAIASSGEIYIQQTPILKAQDAPAGRVREKEGGAGRSSAKKKFFGE
jgi:hypothetical protein